MARGMGWMDKDGLGEDAEGEREVSRENGREQRAVDREGRDVM